LITLTSAASLAQAAQYPLSSHDLIGKQETITAGRGYAFETIAESFDVAFAGLRIANPNMSPYFPPPGAKIIIPSHHVLPPGPREGIVVNLPELQLYFYDQGNVYTYPVGIGGPDWPTPTANTKVTDKEKDPKWRVPDSILAEAQQNRRVLPEVMEAGENNPLGAYAIRLNLPGYLIHGTNHIPGVGKRISHGCMRMYPIDIQQLFQLVKLGTQVRIIHEPIKAGRDEQGVWLEVHPQLPEHEVSAEKSFENVMQSLTKVMTPEELQKIDQSQVRTIWREARGVPVLII
jgi:L,D-transpeptidase ErfK/SrfK